MKLMHLGKRNERINKCRQGSVLNLVSLMDIFTILVFFLLINSSSVQQLPSNKKLTLPQASSEKLPGETLVVMVSDDAILVQGRAIVTVSEAVAGEEKIIKPLYEELRYQAGKGRLPSAEEGGRELTILGDKSIPYRLLKRIMVTSNRAGYTTLSLAVTRKAKG